jgi:hypothetical protein
VYFSNASALHKEDNVIDVRPTMAFELQRALLGYNIFLSFFLIGEACSRLQVQPIQHIIDEQKHNDR